MSVNKAIILGNVGRDPEIKTLKSGEKVANFSIATSESWKDKATGERREKTDWHNIVVFNPNIVGVVEKYVRKGSKVYVEGAIKTREYEDRDGNKRRTTEIVIENFRGNLSLEGGKSEAGSDDSASATNSAPLNEQLDDDIPF